MSWRIVADWKPGMKDSNGNLLIGSIPVWNGKTRKAANEALKELAEPPKTLDEDALVGRYREQLQKFRIEKV